MKKLIFLSTAMIFTVSCAETVDSDSPQNNQISSKITPPTWIQGEWVDKETYDILEYKIGYIFRPDDVCMLSISSETCLKEAINLHNSIPNTTKANIVQSISEIEYRLSMTIASQTTHFNFQRLNTNEIRNIETGTIYTKL